MSYVIPAFAKAVFADCAKAQVRAISVIAVLLYIERHHQRPDPESLGGQLAESYPESSLKTWQNRVSAAKALLTHTAAANRLSGLYAAAKSTAGVHAPFADWLMAECKAHGYVCSVDDIAAFARGGDSAATKLRAATAAKKIAEAERKTAADKAAHAEQARRAEQGQPVNDEGRQAHADGDGDASKADTSKRPDPVQAPQQAIRSDLLAVYRDESGGLVVIGPHPSMTPDELRAIGEALISEADVLETAAAVPATA